MAATRAEQPSYRGGCNSKFGGSSVQNMHACYGAKLYLFRQLHILVYDLTRRRIDQAYQENLGCLSRMDVGGAQR